MRQLTRHIPEQERCALDHTRYTLVCTQAFRLATLHLTVNTKYIYIFVQSLGYGGKIVRVGMVCLYAFGYSSPERLLPFQASTF